MINWKKIGFYYKMKKIKTKQNKKTGKMVKNKSMLNKWLQVATSEIKNMSNNGSIKQVWYI